MPAKTDKVKVKLFCPQCYHQWEQYIGREELRKLGNKEAFTECPECGKPV